MYHLAEDMAEIEKGGDTMATLMGWLDDVDAGGGTVFTNPSVVKVSPWDGFP